MRLDRSFRRRLLLASALVTGTAPLALAQTASQLGNNIGGNNAGGSSASRSGSTGPSQGTPALTPNTSTSGGTVTTRINVRAQRLLVRERNSPSAVTELGTKQIAQVGVQGSIATLLRQAPSINVYQQGIGNNEPVISVRGTRGLETAQTLDDIPMQDLLNGGTGSYLNGILGGRFNLDQISGVAIYPGVAYPDKNTFGTIGGTIAYDSLRPTATPYFDVTGSVGSFQTFSEGFTANSGALDGALGTGYNAPSFLLKYSNLSTQGYIDNTPAHFNNMEFAFDKPYDDGLSLAQATVLYNTANGLYQPEPVPLPYLAQNGMFSNYSTDEQFDAQQNDYLSIFLKDRTYINDWLTVGGSVFYLPVDGANETYSNVSTIPVNGGAGSVTVDGASPFNQTAANFGSQAAYLPGGVNYQPPIFTYNGNAAYPPGSAACPAAVNRAFVNGGDASPCGYNSTYSTYHTDTYGIQPRITITPPNIDGIRNTIIVGALIAKETEGYSPIYYGGYSQVPQTMGNLVPNSGTGPALSTVDGGVYRSIYQGFAQDKIDLFQNTLHVTPGVTLETTATGANTSEAFGGTPTAAELATPYCQSQAAAGSACVVGNYKISEFDREWLPFVNVSYDFDKILPAAKGLTAYGSYGESALFAPTTDFSANTVGGPPTPSIVHLYEGGVKYDTSTVAVSADYFYQKVSRDFGFFENQNPGPDFGQNSYTNDGIREFKGVEMSADWRFAPHWELFANGSHILAKYLATSLEDVTVQEDQFGLGLRGTPISGIPNWLSTFGIDYDRKDQFINQDELHVRFQGQYTGRQYTTTDLGAGADGYGANIGPIPGAPAPGTYGYYNFVTGSTITNVNNQLPAYVVFNLDANYSLPAKVLGVHSYLKKIDFDLNILNLFDEKFFQYFYAQISPGIYGNFPATAKPGFAGNPKNPYSGVEFQDGLAGEPFAATFTITARF